MNRHVIKGRGENRGKYLCYARMAGLPPEASYVWLPKQRKAARWADPRYSGRTYATGLARQHNGYFVKLVAPAAITSALVGDMRTFIAGHAAGAEERLRCYWFGGHFHDAGEEFCRDCAEKLVDEKYAADPKRFEELFGECDGDDERYDAAIDGGFDIEHDSSPYCETCGAHLSGYLTDYGADEEIEALTGECAPAFDDVEGWAEFYHAITNLSDDDPRWRKIACVVEAAMGKEAEAQAAAAALAASPGMPEARAALLGMLSARGVQKAPEPSFRLWEELKVYLRLPFDDRYNAKGEVREVEKRLLKEADAFAKVFGYQWIGNCLEAPFGTYSWPFVVRVEQHRLWQTPSFLEGRAYMLHPCPSGDPEWPHHRDANPHAEGTDEHDAWDAGYISASGEAR